MAAAWTSRDSCTPGCTPDPAPPDIYGWWSGAPWSVEGSGCFSNMRRCTGRKKQKRGEEEQRTRALFKGFPTDTSQRPTSHGWLLRAVHSLEANAAKISLCVNRCSCLLQRQIWVTPGGSWGFRINAGVSCYPKGLTHSDIRSFQLLLALYAESKRTDKDKNKSEYWNIWNLLSVGFFMPPD